MIDSVSTVIVAYADEVVYPTFNEAYPYRKSALSSEFINGVYCSWEIRVTTHLVDGEIVPFVLAADNSFGAEYAGYPIYALLIRQYGSEVFSIEDSNSYIGVCYYIFVDSDTGVSNSAIPGEYWRLISSDIPDNIINSITSSVVVEGEGVIWLYNFGQYVYGLSSSFFDIINFNIGGYSILGLLIGGGFIVYMSWTVVKWIIPR